MGNTSSSNDLGSRPEYLEKTFMVKVHTEKLRKRGVLNGLSFEGDDYDKLGSLKVSRLSSYHKLASEGGLKVGDHIIAINNYKVRHQNLVEAVQHLLSCVSNQTKIYLEVHRPAPAINEPNYVDFFGSFAAEAPVKLLTFVISRELNVGLGMTVGLEKGKVGLFIKQISKNGCAAKNGRLMVGDEIVQLNGVDLTWQYPDCVEALVKKADCVKITVRRNVKNIGTNALLNVKTSNGECFATPMYHATNSYNNPQTGKKDKQKGIKVGGVPNQLNEVGKVALERMQAGDFCKQVTPFSLDSFAQMSMDEKPQKGLKKGKHIVYVDFEETRAECLKKKKLFEDPQFPADGSSLYMSPRKDRAVTWLRPHQICKKPQLIVDGNSRFDVKQGQLGDCWFIAAVANLAIHTELFHRVVPPNQSFTQKYAGIFHFQFWRYGRWVDVVVDDRLPVRTGTNRLVYMSSATPNEFWSPLLEKAYAKLNGSYEALEGGHSSDAMEDMTGGLAERLTDLMQIKRSLIKQIYSSNQMGSLMGCSMGRNSLADSNHRMPNGLITSHAYSITDAKNIGSAGSPMWLLRIRNPWGDGQQWNGDWSDNSKQWLALSTEFKDEHQLTFSHDGEFWMSFEDFIRNFTLVEICHLGPDVMEEVCDLTGLERGRLLRSAIWVSAILHSNWRVSEGTAGGHLTSHSSLKSFWKNPQFLFRVKPNPAARKHVATGERKANGLERGQMSTVIVALMQKYRRRHKSEGWENLVIGFEVYKVSDNWDQETNEGGPGKCFESERYFSQKSPCIPRVKLVNCREVMCRYGLTPGEYVIVPCTQQPNQDADFMLRLFSNGIFTKQLEQLPK